MKRRQAWFVAALVAAMSYGCDEGTIAITDPLPDPDHQDASVPIAWFELQLHLVQTTPGFTPPVASRAFGYAGVALYEAIQPGLPDYQSLAGQLNELPALPEPDASGSHEWAASANAALARITRRLFASTSATNVQMIDALEDAIADPIREAVPPAVFQRSVDFGRSVADAVFEWSKTDGGHEGYKRNFPQDYVPPVGPGMWVPTPRRQGDPLPALQPYWGDNRPFVLPAAGQVNSVCAPGPPPLYSEEPGSAFHDEAMEVYEAVNGQTPEQLDIALFWADDPGATSTPPGHSISILNQVLEERGASLTLAAEAYAKVGIAVADAFVSCWYTKYRYNLIRPITYIQQVVDPDWNLPDVTDPVETPPFPEYTSGHSVQSGAAAQVLTDLFGNLPFTDHTHDARGYAPRSFESFLAFADEAAISRLYGGIHYRAAIDNGVLQGRCVGERVSALRFRR